MCEGCKVDEGIWKEPPPGGAEEQGCKKKIVRSLSPLLILGVPTEVSVLRPVCEHHNTAFSTFLAGDVFPTHILCKEYQ